MHHGVMGGGGPAREYGKRPGVYADKHPGGAATD